MILPYYAVIGGWVLKYCLVYLTGEGSLAASDTYFSSHISQTGSPIILFLIFLLVTAIVVAFGVQKGVERISKILMPVLIVIAIGVSIYVLTLPDAIEGLKYYLVPDISQFSFKTIAAAAGQLFFSLSIAMGIMVSYGSYVRDDVSLVKSVNQVELFDTLIALLSGLMIIPPVVIYSGAEATASKGPGLMFMALPKVFDSMPAGTFIGALFFILVLLAALTSSISILEATTSMLMDRWKLSRTKSVIILTVFSILLGIAVSLGFGLWSDFTIGGMDLLTFFDYITNSVLMPIVTFFTCILIGWIVGTKALEAEIQKNGEVFRRKLVMRVMIKYVTPVMMVLILIFYNLAQFGIISL
ncbi:sodium-dependent transporter [Eubacterium oxidoreducens]